MPEPGTTAVVIVLPDAAPLLDAAWRIDPALVRRGVPAHVSLFYPFVPQAALTAGDEESVRSLAAGFPRADLLLEEVVTASGFVAVTVPGLQPIVDAFHAHWPRLRPYGGRFGTRPGAHVTVAMGTDDPTATARVRTAVDSLLPLRTRAAAVQLVELTEEGWQSRLTTPLGIPHGPCAPPASGAQRRRAESG
ncbi:2'-5' RNA ligase family protein [Streptomyces sp. 12297]|uniref:2'-5' RNA ligase family protein n=1 Tax=Streptomyces sp. NBC_00239 TaxID=2903640 RepID=UPI002E2B40CF|nr:2'-5' RNA ligase family protein [Streptomyces sp. NBC_00239]